MTANWFMEDEMDTRLEEIKKALESCEWNDGICGMQAWFDSYQVESALALLTEIQTEQVDVESIRKEFLKSFRGGTTGTLCADVSKRIKRGINHLATRGLLRTNEIEPEGRG